MNPVELQDISAKTIAAIKASLTKTIDLSTGLQGIDLSGPAYELYPVLTPIRNSLPRTRAGIGAQAAQWKQITAVSAPGKPGVAAGARNGQLSYTVVNRTASYKTYGRDDSVVWEAQSQARGFQDVRALSTASLLRMVMIDEENLCLGGNGSTALGTTPTPTLAAGGSGATLPTATYSVIAVALTYWGVQLATTTAPLALSTAAGTNAAKSTNATQAITLGQVLSATVTPVRNAYAYAWFVGTAGSEKLEAITFINSATFSAPLAGTGMAIGSLASSGADNSTDSLEFDGMLTQVSNASTGGQLVTLATGTAGVGSTLTAVGNANIKEIDQVLLAMWNAARVGPDVIYCHAQQAQDISNKIGSPNASYKIEIPTGAPQGHVTGGLAVVQYVNKFTGQAVGIKVHPTIPQGTMFFHTQQLPDYFPGERPSGAFDLHMLDEYYEEEYGRVNRKWEHGVYAQGVLRGFINNAQAILTNIAAG